MTPFTLDEKRYLLSLARVALEAEVREAFGRHVGMHAFVEQLVYSPDEAAGLLGLSRELVYDLLRTGHSG